MTGHGGTERGEASATDSLASLERQLRRSRDALRQALDAGRMGTWSWDIASDEVSWDGMLCELFGVETAPRSFEAWLELMHPDDRSRVRATVEAAVREGKGFEIMRRVVLPDGSVRHLDARADVIVGDDGSVVGLRGVTLDATDREEARLHAERLASYARLLADAGAVLAATLDPDQVLRRLAELVVPALADGCEVTLVEPGGGLRRIVRAEGVDEARLRRREHLQFDLAEAHPIAEVLRTGTPLRLDARHEGSDAAFGSADDDTTAASFGITEAVIVPMTVRGDVIGALALGVGPSRRHLDDEVIDVAVDLGARAALCFDNARLFCEQRAIAETLQQSLVPAELPSLPWLELAGRYWIPGAGIEVGGDFYDAFHQVDAVTLVVGDVCGKGIEAASLTALARHTLRTALVHVGDPVAALRWLHDAFRDQAHDSYVTAVVVSLAFGPDGSVRGDATIGGHPRPLIVRADGSTETIDPAGTAPGLPVYSAAPVVGFELRPGDALILYTDGVTDVPGSGALSPEEFADLVARVSAGSAGDVVTAIGRHLEEIRPFELRTDDIAVVVAKVPS